VGGVYVITVVVVVPFVDTCGVPSTPQEFWERFWQAYPLPVIVKVSPAFPTSL
jgi:hypothetical protein